jgi:oligoribonuclease NrnB/cAMP/cGMP phosphodiesterase (DHH superfamily)
VNINYNDDGTVRYRDIIPSISLYHWLMGANIEEDDISERFNALVRHDDPWADGDEFMYVTQTCYTHLEQLGAEPQYYTDRGGHKVEKVFNTYNDGDCLDQVIQYQHLTIGESYMDMLWNEQYNRCMDEEEARSYLEHGEPFDLNLWGTLDENIKGCTDLKWIQE